MDQQLDRRKGSRDAGLRLLRKRVGGLVTTIVFRRLGISSMYVSLYPDIGSFHSYLPETQPHHNIKLRASLSQAHHWIKSIFKPEQHPVPELRDTHALKSHPKKCEKQPSSSWRNKSSMYKVSPEPFIACCRCLQRTRSRLPIAETTPS